MVEQGTHKPLVGGSNPPSATSLWCANRVRLPAKRRSHTSIFRVTVPPRSTAIVKAGHIGSGPRPRGLTDGWEMNWKTPPLRGRSTSRVLASRRSPSSRAEAAPTRAGAACLRRSADRASSAVPVGSSGLVAQWVTASCARLRSSARPRSRASSRARRSASALAFGSDPAGAAAIAIRSPRFREGSWARKRSSSGRSNPLSFRNRLAMVVPNVGVPFDGATFDRPQLSGR